MTCLRLLVIIAATTACGPNAGTGDGSETATTSAGTVSSGEAGGATQTGGSADATGTTADSSSSETGQVGDCGGETCTAAQWCDWTGNTCGVESWDEGICRERPGGCDDVLQPVCGCDGVTHSNECEAQSAGVDVDESGACELLPDTFACGWRMCDARFEYCRLGVSDVGGEPNSWECVSNPDCAVVDCASCLVNEPCGEICGAVGGGLQVTCPGG